ncbi:MAG: GHKL domain-containing protein, partial [Prolixibacteraceae bacterium]|nr:GHKL domain-containing protein [Prolixibacteraceae bacterium]
KLAFQNQEKEKRAAELIIANKELAFQNQEKEKRAEELILANNKLAFQNQEKEKRAAELIIANKELIFQNREKEKRAEELFMANKNLEQFAYIASHDLQEPLRTISNYLQVFEEDYLMLLDENAKKYLHEVKDASKRMSILIKSLLDFSRVGRNLNLIEVDCNQLIANVIADLKSIIETSNAVIEVTDMPKLNLYEPEIRQLFQNLILNAIKFQKKDNQAKIQIRSERINEKWIFSVADNGIGIAPAHFEKIFDIFQRIHNNEDVYKGMGIGLSNCKKIVQMHHGEIWVESDLGIGATFYFTLTNITV